MTSDRVNTHSTEDLQQIDNQSRDAPLGIDGTG